MICFIPQEEYIGEENEDTVEIIHFCRTDS